MSTELKKVAAKLIKLVKLSKSEIKSILKSANKRLIKVLSEIALNAQEGVIHVASEIKNSKLVQVLADRAAKLREKKKVLLALTAPAFVQILISAAMEILKLFCK